MPPARLDFFLRRGKIIDLKPEMVRSDVPNWIFDVVSLLAREIKQRKIDNAVAHIDGGSDFDGFPTDFLKAEYLSIKIRRLFEVADADCKMPQASHGHLLDWTDRAGRATL